MRMILQGEDDSVINLLDQFAFFNFNGVFNIASFISAGYDSVDVYALGAGGAGGGGGGNNYATPGSAGGGGGGGGGGSIGVVKRVALSSLAGSTAVTVGVPAAGGIASSNSDGYPGSAGQASSFGNLITGYGGGGGGSGHLGGNNLAPGDGGGGGAGGGAAMSGNSAINYVPGYSDAFGGRGGYGGRGPSTGVGSSGWPGNKDAEPYNHFGGGGGGGGGHGHGTGLRGTGLSANTGGDGAISNQTSAGKRHIGWANSNYGYSGDGGGGGAGTNIGTATAGIYLPDSPFYGRGGRGGYGGTYGSSRYPTPGDPSYGGCVLVRIFKSVG